MYLVVRVVEAKVRDCVGEACGKVETISILKHWWIGHFFSFMNRVFVGVVLFGGNFRGSGD